MIENKNKKLKIALVHDFLVSSGGAERVLREFCKMYPDAPIYTMLYDKEKMHGMFSDRKIITSYLQRLPKFLRKKYHWLLPFFLVIPETFDFRDFDLVISSSGAWAKGIVAKLDTIHIAYIHSPMRFVWDYNEKYLRERNMRLSVFKRSILSFIRIWDRLAAERPDFLIANSIYTQKRIEKYYRRKSVVIYPPVAVKQPLDRIKSSLEKNKKYFLVVSRLSPSKKIDIVVEAFNKLELPLIIIGEGKHEKYLKKIAKDNIKILGWKSDDDLREYYANAQGFIFSAEDDFGITIVEAMAQGIPVIAYRKGGALEIIQEEITGEFFNAQTPEVLADGVRRFMLKKDFYNKDLIKKRAAEFSSERFRSEFRAYIDNIICNNKDIT